MTKMILNSVRAIIFFACADFVAGNWPAYKSRLQDITWIPEDMLPAMNTNVDPCEDFYYYACGGFIQTATIPPYETSYSLGWSKMRDQLEADVISVLEKDSGEAGTYYKSCLNTEAVEKQGIKGIVDWLQAADEVKSLDDLTEFMITAELFDFSVFFSTGVSIDQLDPKHYITSLSRGKLTLPGRQYYENSGAKYERIRSTFLQQATKLFKLTGLSEAAASENARNVMDIETEISKGMVSKAKLRKMNQKLTTIPELDALLPSVQWAHFFRELEMHPVLQTCNGTATGRCGAVAMREPSYFSHLETAIFRRFDLAAIRSFLRWRVIRVFTPYLTEAFRNEAHYLHAEIYGVSETSPAPKRCFKATISHLPNEASKLYVDAYFPHSSAVDTRWMLERIRNEYSADIARLDWMDGATRARALGKLARMGFEIGFPAGWKDLLRLPPLALSPDRYLENTVMLMVRSSHREREKLVEPVDRERWTRPAAIVNAFYSPDRNTLFIPAGILQPPFYLPGGALPRNYGGIGSVLGHEMSHSLDDSGSRYDEEGRLEQWWDDGTLARFRAKTRCVARQYGAFTDVEGEHINGNLTLGETIADGGGLHMSYAAMETAMPGATAGDRRLFYLSFAQLWCRVQRPDAEHAQVLTDPHPPSRFRVLGTLQNSAAFAEAFACPAGSTMNPPDKCVVW